MREFERKTYTAACNDILPVGRLGLDVRDIERHDRPPHTQTVLSDLIDWLDEHPGQSFAKLVNWQVLDIPLISARLEQDRSAKPRIEISAHITKMNNLSVRWHPGGWRRSVFVWDFKEHTSPNLIPRHKWSESPDFHWFVGDEDPTFDARPTNELMYLRGVGSLDPAPDTRYGPYAGYNHDVIDSILICAVRSAYERLIEQCRLFFEVDMFDAFDFSLRDELDDTDSFSRQFPLHRLRYCQRSCARPQQQQRLHRWTTYCDFQRKGFNACDLSGDLRTGGNSENGHRDLLATIRLYCSAAQLGVATGRGGRRDPRVLQLRAARRQLEVVHYPAYPTTYAGAPALRQATETSPNQWGSRFRFELTKTCDDYIRSFGRFAMSG
jgi:hypothetical protein